ncbi:MAG: L,D-transpeptidase [Comamonadaceae bacterium]|nr:L,D-transpeptidase [Comamonadaceae bacterium]
MPPHANAIGPAIGTSALQIPSLRQAHWGDTPVSNQVKKVASWSAATQDHAGMPFVVVDKQSARLYVFDASARLQADTAVLLGSAIGDHTVPGVGDKAIADVLPEERTTPAGRFNGLVGENLSGEDVVWVDYDAAVSMHRVRAHRASERRLERLASPTIEDNRISYGCINVPVEFFETHILPVFSRMSAAIYVLPDQLTLDEVFSAAP